jgi:hypothetical protein
MADLLRLTASVPNLRLVIDHLPKLEVPADTAARKTYENDLAELARRPLSYVKLSAVLRNVDGKVPVDVAFSRDRRSRVRIVVSWPPAGPLIRIYGFSTAKGAHSHPA